MKSAFIILLSISTLQVFGSDKSTITLSKTGYSVAGGGSRAAEIQVKISNGLNNGPMTSEEKITALQQKISFYKLMKSKNVNLSKPITATFTNKSLSEVFKELIPNVPIVYKGAKPEEMVKSMAVSEASLEMVLSYLDEGTGVYFRYTETEILVSDQLK